MKEKIDGFRKKLKILEFEISECPEDEVKSKIGNIFLKEKILAECSVIIYKIDPYFFNHYEELIKVGKNGRSCILFRIDIYFLN